LASTDEPRPLAWLAPVAEILDALDVEWVMAGAVAAHYYRDEQRFTTDLDFLVRWDDRLPDAFGAAGYDVTSMADRGEHPHLLLLRRGSERVDLIVAVVEYQQLAIDRGLDDRRLTVEDVIIHKLIAWRPRDRDDIASILAAAYEFDEAYLDRWVAEWQVEERWRKARESGR
jgi:hypothetical protein